MSYKDPEQQKEAQRRSYKRNKERIQARQKERRAELTSYVRNRRKALAAYVRSLKEGQACFDCGEVYPPPVLEYDHVRGKKVASIKNMVQKCASLENLEAEIAKCELVCANCHRLRHIDRPWW